MLHEETIDKFFDPDFKADCTVKPSDMKCADAAPGPSDAGVLNHLRGARSDVGTKLAYTVHPRQPDLI